MKILTIGISPYTNIAYGKLHERCIKSLYLNNHSVASLVWHHDPTLFTPEESENRANFYFSFKHNDKNHKIPIVPFSRGLKEASVVYDLINEFKPDVILTIGDIDDFMFMKAIKMFSESMPKWGAIVGCKELPMPEEDNEIFDYIDAILCSSKNFYEYAKIFFKKDFIDYKWIGSDEIFNFETRSSHRDENKILCIGKNCQSDNLPMVMECVSEIRPLFPQIKLHVHANIYDKGDYNLVSLRDRFDPNHEFISFPDKFVSLFDGLNIEDYADLLCSSSVYIHPHLVSSTSLSVFETLGCGCFPILNRNGSDEDISKNLVQFIPRLTHNEILVDNVPFITSSGGYLYIPSKTSIKEALKNYFKKPEKYTGYKKEFLEFSRKYNQRMFDDGVEDLLEHLNIKSETLCLET